MKSIVWFCLAALLTFAPPPARANPEDDANAVLSRWSAAYTANDEDAILANYWPDAVLLGTVSPVISIGTEALRTYFAALPGSGARNEVTERHTLVLDDNNVVITGFYLFTSMRDGQMRPRPSRFTMVMTRRDGVWRILHHHSSPHVTGK